MMRLKITIFDSSEPSIRFMFLEYFNYAWKYSSDITTIRLDAQNCTESRLQVFSLAWMRYKPCVCWLNVERKSVWNMLKRKVYETWAWTQTHSRIERRIQLQQWPSFLIDNNLNNNETENIFLLLLARQQSVTSMNGDGENERERERVRERETDGCTIAINISIQNFVELSI